MGPLRWPLSHQRITEMSDNASRGRASHLQHTHYLRKSFDISTLGVQETGVCWVGTLPPGAIVLRAFLKVHTAFNSTASDVLDVGTEADPDAIIAAADLQAEGGFLSVTGMDMPMPTVGTPVYLRWTKGGTIATAGSATVIVEYSPNNDQ